MPDVAPFPILDRVPKAALAEALSHAYIADEVTPGHHYCGLCFWGVLLTAAGASTQRFPNSEQVTNALMELGTLRPAAVSFATQEAIIGIASLNDDGLLTTRADMRHLVQHYSSYRFEDFPVILEGETLVTPEGDLF